MEQTFWKRWEFGGDREVIAKIVKTEFVTEGMDDQHLEDDYGMRYEGYVITTNKRRIKIGVSTGQSCCEVTGYFTSEDDPKCFIGKQLVSVAIVDELFNKKQIDQIEYRDQGGVMFVNFETPDDTLQFVVYNSHNGYYGHTALVEVEKSEVTHSTWV